MISHIMIDVIIPRYIVASGEISIYSNTKLIVIKLKSILLRRVIMRDNDLYTAMIHVINMIDGIPLDMDSGDDYKYESLLNKSISNVIENLPQDDIEVCDLIVSIMSYIVGSLISHDMNMRWIKTLDSKFQVIAMNSINDIRIEQGYMLIKCADIENSFVGKE